MWVIIYICLTRKGPGGARRDELRPDAPLSNDTKALHTIVYSFFDSEDRNLLALNKQTLFLNRGDMETYVLSRFSPYFDVLKPLVSAWWGLLQRSYEFYTFTNIHDEFLTVINGTIKKMQPDESLSTPDDCTDAEVGRRQDDLRHALNFERKPGSKSKPAVWSQSPDRVTTAVDGYKLGAVSMLQPPGSPSPMRPTKKSRMVSPKD